MESSNNYQVSSDAIRVSTSSVESSPDQILPHHKLLEHSNVGIESSAMFKFTDAHT